MLDDSAQAVLTRPLIVALEESFFTWSHSSRETPKHLVQHSVSYDLRVIQELQRRSGIWKLVYVYDTEANLVVFHRLKEYGVSFLGTLSVETHGLNGVREEIQACDLVYAPTFCDKYKIRPTLQPPSSVRVAMGIITYFSVSLTPFSPAAYYAALKLYDPTSNLGVA